MKELIEIYLKICESNTQNQTVQTNVVDQLEPLTYKDFDVTVSDKNEREDHFNERIKDRVECSIQDIKTIIEKSLDVYLSDNRFKQYHKKKQSFSFKSKSQTNIKIKVIIEPKNNISTLLNNPNQKTFKFSCILNTILYNHMIDKHEDVNIITEQQVDQIFEDTVEIVVD